MALVWAATATVRDAKGQTAKIPFHIETADLTAITDAADDPVEFMQEFARVVDPLIGGQIIDLKLTVLVALPVGLKTAPLADSDVEEGVVFMLRSTTGAPVRIRVATWDENFLTTEGTLTDDTEVTDLVELMTIPEELPADWTIGISDNRGAAVNRLFDAQETFKEFRGETSVKGTDTRPEILRPFDPRHVPLVPPAPDVCDAPTVTICVNSEWWSHLDGMISRLLYRDAWQGTEDDIDRAIEQIQEILAVGKADPMGCCCGNSGALTRYNENGELEISTDGGATWQPYPQGDPRLTSPVAPPIPGDDGDGKKCLAAQSATEFIKGQFVDQLNDGMVFTQIFELLLSVIAILLTGPGAQLIVPVILTVVGGAVNTVPSVIQAAFDATQVGILQCILYCRASADGSFTEAAWQGVKADIASQMNVAVAEFVKGIVNAIGPVGLTNASRAGLTTGITDCSACDCPVECMDESNVLSGTFVDMGTDSYVVDSGPDFYGRPGEWVAIGTDSLAGFCCKICSFEIEGGVSVNVGCKTCAGVGHSGLIPGELINQIEIASQDGVTPFRATIFFQPDGGDCP